VWKSICSGRSSLHFKKAHLNIKEQNGIGSMALVNSKPGCEPIESFNLVRPAILIFYNYSTV
jgi:hypothetical protein